MNTGLQPPVQPGLCCRQRLQTRQPAVCRRLCSWLITPAQTAVSCSPASGPAHDDPGDQASDPAPGHQHPGADTDIRSHSLSSLEMRVFCLEINFRTSLQLKSLTSSSAQRRTVSSPGLSRGLIGSFGFKITFSSLPISLIATRLR